MHILRSDAADVSAYWRLGKICRSRTAFLFAHSRNVKVCGSDSNKDLHFSPPRETVIAPERPSTEAQAGEHV